MKPFLKTQRGRVFDVKTRDRSSLKKWLFFWRDGGVVNLRYRKYRLLAISGVFLLILLSFFSLKNILTRAEVADFHAQTCLGTWQNPERAQGEPENLTIKSSKLSEENSAVFTALENKIFCGQFIPENFEARGEIKSVSLTLVWEVKGFNNADQGVEIIESENQEKPTDTPPEPETTSKPEPTPAAPPTSEEITPEPEAAPKPQPESFDPSPPSSGPAPKDEPFNSVQDKPFNSVQNEPLNSVQDEPETAPEPESEPNSENTDEPAAFRFLPIKTAQAESTSSEKAPAPEPSLEKQDAPKSLDEVTSTEELLEILEPPIYEPTEDFLRASYSLDGQDWLELKTIDSSNWQNFTVSLPVISWKDLKKLQISIEGIPTTLAEIPKVFLDGMVLEIQYDLPPILGALLEKPVDEPPPLVSEETQIIELDQDQSPIPTENLNKTFRSDETPRFDLDLELLPVPNPPPLTNPLEGSFLNHRRSQAKNGDELHRHFSFKEVIKKIFGSIRFANAGQLRSVGDSILNLQNPVVAQIIDPENRPTDLKPILLTVNNKLRISIPEPNKRFQPGKYRLELWILKNGVIYFTQTDFTWGVLAVNFNKSVYSLGDESKIGLAVLDDRGFTICDAKVEMTILSPSGAAKNLSTSDGTIALSDECGPISVTNTPDYEAAFKTAETGKHEVFVRAETKNGAREINDSFEVQDPPLFDIERFAPTRIYPIATYKVELRIKANQDFKGQIIETLPSSFDLITELASERNVAGEIQTVTWPADLKAGEEIDLKYFFDPPDISPELYKLGPLTLSTGPSTGSGPKPVFQENRFWQIASDASGDIILFWDGDVIPTGWDCISCDPGDPFIDVFPRPSSTYGSASTTDNIHDLTFSTSTGPSTANNNITDADFSSVANDTHTHPWANASTTAGAPPLHRGLRMISAATTSLPNGVIGIFDVASVSLPSDWTYYSALDDLYVMGSSTVGNAGSSTHDHTFSNIVSGAPTTVIGMLAFRGGTVANHGGHTNTITGKILASDDNNPPFITVVFGQTTATTTLGTNSNGLIAMFDNTALPTDWGISSTAGSVYDGNLLYGSSTFGVTGGNNNGHSHGTSTVFTSGTPSATSSWIGTTVGVGGSSHTHNVTYNIESVGKMPIYRDVILGKYTAPTAALVVSNVILNPGAGGASSSITLTANTTTTITAVASTSAAATSATGTIFRSGASGGADCAADNQNCYQISTCALADSSQTVQCSADIWYFADATDVSSSYPTEDWMAQITATNGSTFDTSSTVTGQTASDINTLVSVVATASSILYDIIENANTSTVASNPVTIIKNVGNASASINVAGTAFKSGSNEISTSSQHYATSSFVFDLSNEQTISDTAANISGTTMPPRVSLINDLKSWTDTTALPKATGDIASVVHNGYLYVIGGLSFSPSEITSTVRYAQISSDGGVGAWTSTTNFPTAISQHAAAVYIGYVYVVVGGISTTVKYAPIASDGTVDAWVNATDLPFTGKFLRQSLTAYGGYLYLAGFNESSTVLYSKINSDGSLGSWTETTALPDARSYPVTLVSNGYIYVTGGKDGGGVVQSTVYYAPINSSGTLGAWGTTTALPDILVDHSGGSSGGYLYVTGGETTGSTVTSTVLYGKQNADGTISTWETASSLSTETNEHSSAIYSNYLYVLGGFKALGGTATSSVFYNQINNGQSHKDIFWGIGITGGTPEGTYTGSSTVSATFEE